MGWVSAPGLAPKPDNPDAVVGVDSDPNTEVVPDFERGPNPLPGPAVVGW